MGKPQKLVLAFFCFSCYLCRADWQATVNGSGFFGNVSAGAIYGWSRSNSFEMSVGHFSIQEMQFVQSNFAYRKSHWSIRKNQMIWNPLGFGVFAINAWNGSRYFPQSPTKYPYANYYDQNAIRWGIELGTVLGIPSQHLSYAYHIRVLDVGVIAATNNHFDLDPVYYIASGLSVRYDF